VPTSPWPDDSGHVVPETFDVEIWMAMARKDVDRLVVVRGMTRADAPRLKDYLRRNAETMAADCDWAKAFPEPDLGHALFR
jgi:hypothetical protein